MEFEVLVRKIFFLALLLEKEYKIICVSRSEQRKEVKLFGD